MINKIITPDLKGHYGNYGGSYIEDENLQKVIDDITKLYIKIRFEDEFNNELQDLREHFIGRPSPIYYCKRLSEKIGGAKIYLKREDINHTGAHKINHCLGEALLAKRLGKKKIIAETGAGSHGTAIATCAALLGLECDVYMGKVDIGKQQPNVQRIKLLGANVIPVTKGNQTLKEAVDVAFKNWLNDTENSFYAIGSVVGPHPFPMMVRDFQYIVGIEARHQILTYTKQLPSEVVACVGGGSNAMGIFSGFIDDEDVKLVGIEPGGKGDNVGEHAATLTFGTPGQLHGFKCYLLQDEKGEPLPVHSVASGLDYPGVGPQHSYLKDLKRATYLKASDLEAIKAFYTLSRYEGIIPALESSHALSYAFKRAKELDNTKSILVNLSGRGDKDIEYVFENYPLKILVLE